MSDDLDGTDMHIISRFTPRQAHSAAGRRVAETKPMHHRDGRKLRTTGRTAQMNLKVRPDFRDHIVAVAEADGIMMVELIEAAVEEYLERLGR